MAQIIRIKRSTVTSAPGSLLEGELAYSELSGNLFIGTSGASMETIGGKTDHDKLLTIETNADVTDTANVNAAGAVMETDFNADTLLRANSDNTPLALNIPEQRLVGRITGGNIDPLTAAQVRTLLNIEDNSAADQVASEVPFTPTGDIVASDVQAAIAEVDTEKLSLAGGTMTGLLTLSGAPSGDLHAATKVYVDSVAQGMTTKDSVRVATTAAGTLASSFENGDTVDDIVLATNDRILIKNQAAAAENGIYVVQASGAPVRAVDADAWGELVSAFVFVEEGTTNSDSGFVCTVDAGGTLDTTAVTFTQFSGAGTYTADGIGIELSGTTFGLELDGTTLSKTASGLKVNSIYNSEINGSAAIDFSKMATLTGSRALVSDGSGTLVVSATTSTEISYLSGVTSAIQTQLDNKMEAFTDGTDTPSSYTGHGSKIVMVNSGESALEFVDTIDGGTF